MGDQAERTGKAGGMDGEQDVMLEPKSEQSSSKKRRVCDVGVKERLATSLPGLPLPTDSVFGVFAYSRSDTDAGPASSN
jgi:hypothetical protein